MTQWTESARAELEAWSRRVRERVAGTGADADEVVDDLRAHLDAEVARRGLRIVNLTDLQQMLTGLGEPDAPAPAGLPSGTNPSQPAPGPKPGISLFFFGVVLPLITLGIELTTHMCAGAFFDPIPTWWHVAVVATVPVVNAILWCAATGGTGLRAGTINWLSGIGIGASAIYTLMFVPLMIPGIFAVVFFGWGLLPWSPCLALIAALKLRSRVRKLPADPPADFGRTGYALGIVIGILALLAPEIPSATTRIAMQWADSEEQSVQRRGLAWLRAVGHEETMRRVCYERVRRFLDPSALVASPDNRLTQEEARTIYFRVTGRPFNALPPPPLYHRAGRWDLMDEEFTWNFDTGLGGEAVSGRVRGLTMIASRLDGVVESDAGTGYTEWIMEFRNDATVQREARAQLALPPGGVVSRLTLWINGEEREAAFGGRSQVREAYQQVAVQQRRDPVLVTTAGPDRVLMQCFPVPPDGGTMKVRVGITAPIKLTDPWNARLAWPQIIERNFNLAPQLRHSLWVESRAALSCNSDQLRIARRDDDRSGLQGELSDRELHDPANHLKIVRAAPVADRVWTAALDGGRIEQVLRTATNVAPGRVVVVLDGSGAMAGDIAGIARALEAVPGDQALHVLMATDREPEGWLEFSADDGVARADLLNRIRAFAPVGGQDNLPALRRAWDLASEVTDGVLIWIHGPQPVLLDSVEGLRQRLERGGARTRFIDFQTQPGPSRVAERLDGQPVSAAFRAGPVEDDLRELLGTLAAGDLSHSFERTRLASPGDGSVSPEVSKHIARLWALDDVRRLSRQRFERAAVKLAGDYQLVTPVSGAVVLETQAQYDLAGLTPVDAATVPVVPEPSVWMLLGAGMLLLLLLRRTRQPAQSVKS